ncbi:30S ribosomal protein S1 [Acidaminobacter sp.]|uniref:30S ribosomal protein S1 n=1 Tax=Acidaminobacter sp. TaxID=1872102 RepID=UPI00137FED48|nr:30S ribosomal protein S1 [Acidaminobacter sp.]MDK9711423.1 30S ribosomal protein S1 [Acidaminobacter sp.]MZQ97014.1 30S ribosomal protein S1 [Acidaminobacter sp.]
MENNSMEQFMDQIDESLRAPRSGSIVKGKVVQVKSDEIIVNIGYKADGVIPLEEISSAATPADLSVFEENQEIEVYVIKNDNGDGNVLLSLKRVSMYADWGLLEEAYAAEQEIEVKVTETVKGGVVAYYQEARGFIPASQISTRYVNDLKEYVGKTMMVKIIEFNREKRRAVFSRKTVLQKENAAKKEAVWEKVFEGAVVQGEVKRITSFGVFIDLGGIDGMAHISELTWGRINKPQEVVKIGDVVEVKVISIDKETEKISLSIKQLKGDPWTTFMDHYTIGGIFESKVVNLTDFGAFVELEPGVEGLVHVSQIARKRVEKPSDELKVGEKRLVKLLDVDLENRRIKLSMKEAEEEAAEEAEEAEVVETIEATVDGAFSDDVEASEEE